MCGWVGNGVAEKNGFQGYAILDIVNGKGRTMGS